MVLIALLFNLNFTMPLWAYDTTTRTEVTSTEKPKELTGVGITEHLGSKIDLGLEFTNDEGVTAPLSTYFQGHKPVILTVIYYNCPNLCNYQLNGLLDVLKEMKGKAGKDYEVVAVSMDHKETAELAQAKKATYMKALKQPDAEKGWHLLVGNEENVKALTQQLGFGFRWDENLKQYAHAAAVYVMTPAGQISRYLYGIAFSAQTLRMSLVEASNGKIGDFVEQVADFCFQFDPGKGKFVIASFRIMQAGAALTVFLLAIFLVPIWMRERQRKADKA